MPLLSAVPRNHELYADMPCGGKGVCGKRRVEAKGLLSPETEQEQAMGSRLVCQTRLLNDTRVTLLTHTAVSKI
jgi:uncharacterized 2Fe-2S/4Fe-4S cluster protein (DUF4445 family)